MGRAAWFAGDLLPVSSLVGHSNEAISGPAENALSDRPGEHYVAGSGRGPPFQREGTFELSNSNRFIDYKIGGGAELNATISTTGVASATGVATIVEAAMNAVSTGGTVFTVEYQGSNRFVIQATDAFTVLWRTGVHGSDNTDNNIGEEIGFSTTADSAAGIVIVADEVRHATHTFLKFQASAAVQPDMVALILDGDDDTEFTDVKLFSSTTDLGFTRAQWLVGGTQLSITDRPARPEVNPLQFTQPAAASRVWWFLSWRHFDESPSHLIGLFKALTKFGSATRDVSELDGHELVDDGDALGPGNFWPAPVDPYWRVPVKIDRWSKSDWDAVIAPIARLGKSKGRVFHLDHSAWADGGFSNSVGAGDVDDGAVVWCSMPVGPARVYSGGSSDFISGRMVQEQIR